MISSGIEALDSRLGSLRTGKLYSFFGPATSGKSVLALHYLVEGLTRGERCVLVTTDEAALIESRAAYVGASAGMLLSNPLLRVISSREQPPERPGMTPRELLEQWLGRRPGETPPSRIVLEGLDEWPEYTRTPHAVLHELKVLLERNGATGYALIRTERGGSFDPKAYEPIIGHSAGAFCLHARSSGERRFEFITAPPGALRTDNFQFSLRIGAGFTEEVSYEAPQITPQERQVVIVLDEIAALPADLVDSLRHAYELEVLPRTAGALGRLSAGRYGALVLTVDPFDEARTFDLIYALRREGNAAPMICVAPSRGLRSTTRSRGLRAGADDFFVTELSTPEMLERIQMVWQRGSQRRSGFSQIGQIMQPVRQDGSARPMTPQEFAQAMAMLLAEEPPLFFCYLEFRVPFGAAPDVWQALRSRLRTADGDIIGMLSDRVFACALDRITADQTRRVMQRIRTAHPQLELADEVVVLANPSDAEAMKLRFASAAADGSTSVAVGAPA